MSRCATSNLGESLHKRPPVPSFSAISCTSSSSESCESDPWVVVLFTALALDFFVAAFLGFEAVAAFLGFGAVAAFLGFGAFLLEGTGDVAETEALSLSERLRGFCLPLPGAP